MKKLKLYLLTQNVNIGWDTYDSCVVAAYNEEDARTITPNYASWGGLYSSWATHPHEVRVKLLGTIIKGVERGVVLASFNAG